MKKDNFDKILKSFKGKSILVLGDLVIDEYRDCKALGKSAESPTIVVKETSIERYIGGAGIIALHIKALTAQPIFMSVVGNDTLGRSCFEAFKQQNVESFIMFDHGRQTTLKTRYISEEHKLLRVSNLDEREISTAIENEIIDRIKKIKNLSGIIVSDFNYGVITKRLLSFIHSFAVKNNIKLFGDSQTSSQYGDVRKMHGYTLLTPNEIEARRALGDNYSSIETIARVLLKLTKCDNLYITLGKDGVVGVNKKEYIYNKAFAAHAIDKMGCGDAMLACSAVSLCAGATLKQCLFLGSVMSAIKVTIKGNIPITLFQLKEGIKKFNKGE